MPSHQADDPPSRPQALPYRYRAEALRTQDPVPLSEVRLLRQCSRCPWSARPLHSSIGPADTRTESRRSDKLPPAQEWESCGDQGELGQLGINRAARTRLTFVKIKPVCVECAELGLWQLRDLFPKFRQRDYVLYTGQRQMRRELFRFLRNSNQTESMVGIGGKRRKFRT